MLVASPCLLLHITPEKGITLQRNGLRESLMEHLKAAELLNKLLFATAESEPGVF